jgi:hypothetical protein
VEVGLLMYGRSTTETALGVDEEKEKRLMGIEMRKWKMPGKKQTSKRKKRSSVVVSEA